MADRHCLVVGGGAVGLRKVRTLLECGARVTVVSLALHPDLEQLASDGTITAHVREYRTSDLDGVFLVICATDHEPTNEKVGVQSRERNLLVNVADRPRECTFILPSVLRRGALVLTISTGGKSPAFAKRLRRELEQRFGPEYGPFLDIMGAARSRLLAKEHAPEEHRSLFGAIIDRGLLDLVRNRDVTGIDQLLAHVLGPGFTLAEIAPETLRDLSRDNIRQ